MSCCWNEKREGVMCPVCIATAALIASSAASTGGVAALVISKLKSKEFRNAIAKTQESKEERHG